MSRLVSSDRLIRAVSHAKKGELQNEKVLPTAGLETIISRLLD